MSGEGEERFNEKTCVFAENAIVFTVGEAFSLSSTRYDYAEMRSKIRTFPRREA